MAVKNKLAISAHQNRSAYLVLTGLAVLLLAMGLFFNPVIGNLLQNLIKTFNHPSTLDFDTFQQAGIGSGFFNCGLLLFVVLGIYALTKTEIQGLQIAAAAMVLGFSVYGKNILNIWFPIIGVFLYAKVKGKSFASVSALACFSTALAPVFNVLAFGTESLAFSPQFAMALGVLLGIIGGYLTGYFADFLPKLHHGYVLYNAGFAAGVSGFLINSALKLFRIGHEKFPYIEIAQAIKEGIRADYVSGENVRLGIAIFILFAYLIVSGIVLNGHKTYSKLFWYKSKGGNYVEEFGLGAALINVGVVGLVATLYVFATINGQISGPVFACIWTAAGFAACGVTVRTQLPLLISVYFSAFVSGGLEKVSSRGMILAGIFSAGLSPIVADFGAAFGMVFAALHSFLVPNTGVLHGWMSLYNNGFSLGLLASFAGSFVPQKQEAKVHQLSNMPKKAHR